MILLEIKEEIGGILTLKLLFFKNLIKKLILNPSSLMTVIFKSKNNMYYIHYHRKRNYKLIQNVKNVNTVIKLLPSI